MSRNYVIRVTAPWAVPLYLFEWDPYSPPSERRYSIDKQIATHLEKSEAKKIARILSLDMHRPFLADVERV